MDKRRLSRCSAADYAHELNRAEPEYDSPSYLSISREKVVCVCTDNGDKREHRTYGVLVRREGFTFRRGEAL